MAGLTAWSTQLKVIHIVIRDCKAVVNRYFWISGPKGVTVQAREAPLLGYETGRKLPDPGGFRRAPGVRTTAFAMFENKVH